MTKEVGSMRRIVLLLSVAALMAAMLVASAMPAFAAVKTKATGFNCDQNSGCTSGTITKVGGSGSKGGGSGGKSTTDVMMDGSGSGSSQGGGKGTGGGNCRFTTTSDLETITSKEGKAAGVSSS